MSKKKKRAVNPNPYVERALQWFDTCPSNDRWESHSPILAVAEYLANQDGTTLWPKEPKNA